jgi:Nucleotidyltransferase domain
MPVERGSSNRIRPARRRPPACGTLLIAMATKPQTLVPGALAERERVLRGHQAEIRAAQGVTRLRLFGSVTRGEADPGSDVVIGEDVLPRLWETIGDDLIAVF